MRTRIWTAVSAASLVLAMSAPAHAAHHLWRIHQLYSNASGSVQFVELETTSTGGTGETGLSGQTLNFGSNVVDFTTLSPAGGTNGPTQWLLIATPAFAGLKGGVTPDFTFTAPGPFFSTGGGTITYGSPTVDTWTYGTVPTDGVNALTRDPNSEAVTVAVNAPTNLDGVAGQLALATATTPALPTWAIAFTVGALLLAGSGLLGSRRRAAT